MHKNGFLTFLFSLIPGCGLMYLGYMKKGLQTMFMFGASGYLASVFMYSRYFEWISVFFIILIPIIWFYQMFDAMHSLAHMKRYEWEVPPDDKYFIPFTSLKPNKLPPFKNSIAAKIIGIILIVAGSYKLFFGILDYMYQTVKPIIVRDIINPLRQYMIPAVVSLALVVIGVKLLMNGKSKNKYVQYITDDEEDDD